LQPILILEECLLRRRIPCLLTNPFSEERIISLFHLLARVTVNIHVILRKMAKPREKVRNAMLHNYDSARYLASKVIKTLGGHVSHSRAVTHILVTRRSLAIASPIFLSTGSTPCLLMLQLTTCISRKQHAWHMPMFGHTAITRGRANRARAK